MQKLEVFGANKLRGQIKISGSKNASLPILAASLLSSKITYLKNLPKVMDIQTMLSLLESLGSKIKVKKDRTIIDNTKQKKKFASYNLVKTMRAGILVLGPLLAKFGSAKVSLPGGCAIGTRPVDLHLKALSKLGVRYEIKQGYVIASAPRGLKGNNIRFSKISVGATENLIIASSFAKGITTLSNCAIEPEIKDLIIFLKKLGSIINLKGRTITIKESKRKSSKILHEVIFDRIELGTYMIACSLLAKKNMIIDKIDPKIVKNEINVLRSIGVKIIKNKSSITIKKK